MASFTGKEKYTFGDITRKVVDDIESRKTKKTSSDDVVDVDYAPYLFTAHNAPNFQPQSTNDKVPLAKILDSSILEELERWDQVFMERTRQDAEIGAASSSTPL